jgi:tetratricopeptide (TPR) repeat protein
MKAEAIVLAVAGAFFGLIAGWILGSQQAILARPSAPPAAASMATQPAASAAPVPKALDESRVQALEATAEREPRNEKARIDLGNLYFDAERYEDAIKWYGQALDVNPRDPDVSTDLGIAYYYLNQPDRALEQFDYSLKIDPKHAKTMLNQGVVRAFGKQDLEGAVGAWQKLIEVSPTSPEGQAAKRALDNLKGAHPNVGAPVPKSPSGTGK